MEFTYKGRHNLSQISGMDYPFTSSLSVGCHWVLRTSQAFDIVLCCCLSCFSDVVIKHTDQGSLQKEVLLWGLLFQRVGPHHHHFREHEQGKHGAAPVSFYLDLQIENSESCLKIVLILWKLKTNHQWHTSPNRATPSQSSIIWRQNIQMSEVYGGLFRKTTIFTLQNLMARPFCWCYNRLKS